MKHRSLLFVLILMCGRVHGQESSPPRTDADLRSHLATLGKAIEDTAVALENRERIALEMAATLDRAALTTSTSSLRRAYWAEAAQILDTFSARNPGHSLSQTFRVQASVYLWARARTWLQAYQANPTDAAARAGAIKEFRECSERFKTVLSSLPPNLNDVLAQNVRYRTAQALADLAEVLPDEVERKVKNTEARLVIEPLITENSLSGFARLLRGTLDARLGAFEKATIEINAAAAAKPAPPASDLLDARLELLLGSRAYDEALRAIEAAPIEPEARTPLKVRVLLALRSGTADIGKRNAAEIALFGELARLRDSQRGDARSALLSTAQAIGEPSSQANATSWDLLAMGAVLLGDPSRAGDLERKGASRAEALKNPELATELLLRAGAFYFQAEKFAEADPFLTRVIDNPQAGPNRARAGMLRILSRGRALALKRPGATEESYAAALKQQIKDFPNDPTTSEARWLYGKLRLAESDRALAISLWNAIPHGHARWLESRLVMAEMNQKAIDTQRGNGERAALEKTIGEARTFLSTSLEAARGEGESNEFLLAIARLELTPKLGRIPEAIAAIEKVQKSATTPSQREASRRLNILALATANRWVEVEQLARQEAQESNPVALLSLVRLIDRAAAETESDLKARRLGYVARLLLSRAGEHLEALDAPTRAEFHLREIRALLFSGDEPAARRALNNSAERLPWSGNEELRDLAETYMKLGAFQLAVDVHRLRSRALSPGSVPWFEARYALALASYRAGKPKEALQLIDGTAILHPDLAGGELRERFLALRQRIGSGNP